MFKLIRNLGSPTRWDITAYSEWIAANSNALTSDLLDAVSEDRFRFHGDRSFWQADMHHVSWSGGSGRIEFRSDNGVNLSTFLYSGIRKVYVGQRRFSCAPCLIVHELLPFRRGYIRHAMSFLGGEVLVVYAKDVAFRECAYSHSISK